MEDDEYRYPQADSVDEYCLIHNVRYTDYYTTCPICDGDLVLAINEGLDVKIPSQFFHLYLFYQNITYSIVVLLILFLPQLAFRPMAIPVMIVFAIGMNKLATSALELSFISYRVLFILTGIVGITVLFGFMITLNLRSIVIPIVVLFLLLLFIYYLNTNPMFTAILRLSNVMTSKLKRRKEYITHLRDRKENLRRNLPSFLIPSIIFLYVVVWNRLV